MNTLIIHDLNINETVEKIVERFRNEDRNKMWSDCFDFINLWKNRVRNFDYKSFAEMEFNMDFLLSVQKKIEELKESDQLELFPE